MSLFNRCFLCRNGIALSLPLGFLVSVLRKPITHKEHVARGKIGLWLYIIKGYLFLKQVLDGSGVKL